MFPGLLSQISNMSLADALLADLDMDEGDQEDVEPSLQDNDNNDVKMEFFPPPVRTMLTLDDVSKLRNSEKLQSILRDIERYSVLSRSPEDIQVNYTQLKF